MNSGKNTGTEAAELRRSAGALLESKPTRGNPPQSVNDMRRLLRELQVYQVELEMQNEELRRAREELEVSRDKYAELYNFAPVGYFAFDPHGVIREVNLAGAHLLGIERKLLANKPFSSLIADEKGREIFTNHLELVLHRRVTLRCEISLKVQNKITVHCQLQSIAVDNFEPEAVYVLTSIVDGSVRHQLEEKLQNAHDLLEKTVQARTAELTRSNVQLLQEIEERKKAEETLQGALAEIKLLKERLQAENVYLQQEVAGDYNSGEIIGQSSAMSYVFFRIEQVAPQNATVLLLGETGTGKGVVARAIHASSARKDRPMITVNCTSLPANLIESELFGREKGAFTGANVRQMGRFELADGGTIFLDEIGEMPLGAQAKILRLIQSRRVRRLGDGREMPVDARIVTATNRSLEELVEKRLFREDLYYRINVLPLTIPPLRERPEDILPLAEHFLFLLDIRLGKPPRAFDESARRKLLAHHWPGNVRELKNVVERSAILCDAERIDAAAILLVHELGRALDRPDAAGGLPALPPGEGRSLPQSLLDFERGLLTAALTGRKSLRRIARELGISHTSLRNKLKKHHLET